MGALITGDCGKHLLTIFFYSEILILKPGKALSNKNEVCQGARKSQVAIFQAPLSLGFPRQEHWSGLPFPPPRDLPDPGIGPASLLSPALAGGFFTTELPGDLEGMLSFFPPGP